MTTYTTAGSGNWNSGVNNAPFVGGAIPTFGDTVTIANGHTLTVPAGYTAQFGTVAGAATTVALTSAANGTGILVVNGTLECGQSVQQANGSWVMNAGAQILAANTTGRITWAISDNNTQASAILSCVGAAGNRVVFDTKGGAVGWGQFGIPVTGWSNGGRITASYTDWNNCGVSGTSWYKLNPNAAGFACTFSYCRFISCSDMGNTSNFANNTTFTFDNCTWKTPVNATEKILVFLFNAWTTGARRVNACSWEGQMQFIAPSAGAASGIDFTENFGRNYSQPSGSVSTIDFGGSAPTIKTWANNVFLYVSGSAPINNLPCGTLQRTIGIANCAATNHHWSQNGLSADTTYDQFIMQSEIADETGDFIQLGLNPATVKTLTLQNSLMLPARLDTTSGSGSLLNISLVGVINVRLLAKNNTVFLGKLDAGSGAVMNENIAPAAGQFLGVKDSIYWRFAQSGTNRAQWHFGAAVPANGAYLGVDYNWFSNCTATRSRYQDADAVFSTPSPPGGNDNTAATPNFVDATRNPVAYATNADATITTLAGLSNAMLKRNDDTGTTPGLAVISNMVDWIFAGFAPKNTAAATASSTGGRIGAVNTFVAGGVSLLRRRRR